MVLDKIFGVLPLAKEDDTDAEDNYIVENDVVQDAYSPEDVIVEEEEEAVN